MSHSITVRLTALFGGAAILVFTVVATGLYYIVQAELHENLLDVLKTRATIARSIVEHVNTPEKWLVVRDRLSDISAPQKGTLIYVQSSDPRFSYGAPIIGSGVASDDGDYTLLTLPDRSYPMVATTMTIAPSGERPKIALTVASDSTEDVRVLNALRWAMLSLFGLASLIVVALGLRLSKIGLMPLHRLSEQAGDLRAGSLGQRLSIDRLPPELLHLTTAFNAALGRLDQAFERLASFNADVAHELRTPIGIVIGETQVALARTRSVDELRGTLASNLEEFERLKGIVNSMMFLARVDRGEYVKELAATSLRRECESLVDFFETLFEDAAITVVIKGDAQVELDVSLFQRALSNLLQNAVEHALAQTEVVVSIHESSASAILTVSNVGVAIPPEKLDQLFDRFYRLEEHRINSSRNHGLGLAIVKAVADIHAGSVDASSVDGINSFTMFLPKVQRPLTDHLTLSQDVKNASAISIQPITGKSHDFLETQGVSDTRARGEPDRINSGIC